MLEGDRVPRPREIALREGLESCWLCVVSGRRSLRRRSIFVVALGSRLCCAGGGRGGGRLKRRRVVCRRRLDRKMEGSSCLCCSCREDHCHRRLVRGRVVGGRWVGLLCQ